ncbi:hypothetical protein LTR37_016690 [Vermiconidia calcicola]|uniref:Uncharacterized protein n=1 Tax=Vermiconidia calcicola TaxID=1690605 RepID=A0ACC3MPZ2_9PEZI|nr:hypothetical protein LTR37_016690 [Vermiconidia calcicola]
MVDTDSSKTPMVRDDSQHDVSSGLAKSVIRIGLIGCGEISQVSHIATLGYLSDYFQVTYLCDVSQRALEHCASKVHGPQPALTQDAQQLCSSQEVDAVVVASATAFHTTHAILALNANKHVFVEKPLALCYRDIEALNAAEQASTGRVFVGYMRRHAPAFEQALKEIGDRPVDYVRVRDIIGRNEIFVGQSGTFPKQFNDVSTADSSSLQQANDDIATQALSSEFGIPKNDDTILFLTILGGLGTHDLSAMREAIGMPKAIKSACLRWPIWTATLDYGQFYAVYESGINGVPVFDAHIEIYTSEKTVRVDYNTPYVRGLPTTVTIRELVTGPHGEQGYQERTVRTTYEDSYTVEFKRWHESMATGVASKTNIADAKQDVDLIKMLMQSAFGDGK